MATAASTAALFSSFTSFLESSTFANLFVTSASDNALSSTVLDSERDFSDAVAVFSASAFSASCFLSKPRVFDSTTTVLKAVTSSACVSTST